MPEPDGLPAARESFAQRDWASAYRAFSSTRGRPEFTTEDLYALADSAWWLGLADESMTLSEEAFRGYLADRHVERAAMLAMQIGGLLMLRGDTAVGSGWMARAAELLEDRPESVAHGYLLFSRLLQQLGTADFAGSLDTVDRMREIALRFEDDSLHALSLVGRGSALVEQGAVAEGISTIDEAMVIVSAGTVEPAFAGNIYCQTIALCMKVADLARARRWTERLEAWCAQFPAAVMFAGICRVHRAQLLNLQGLWDLAEREAAKAAADLERMNVAAVAEAHYEIGDIRRQRGDLHGAGESYRAAHRLGHGVQPGMAYLRLAEGDVKDARAAIEVALSAILGGDPLTRSRLLAASIDMLVADGDAEAAARAADELDAVAARFGGAGLHAMARRGRGSALLASGDARAALPALQEACRLWSQLDAPCEAARTRLLTARAFDRLGDARSAAMELDAAEETFRALGADALLAEVRALREKNGALPAKLTEREAEVLALVAAGKTNKQVAAELVLAEKTIARHLSNIFSKIGVETRTAAAAFAFQHGIASRRG